MNQRTDNHDADHRDDQNYTFESWLDLMDRSLKLIGVMLLVYIIYQASFCGWGWVLDHAPVR